MATKTSKTKEEFIKHRKLRLLNIPPSTENEIREFLGAFKAKKIIINQSLDSALVTLNNGQQLEAAIEKLNNQKFKDNIVTAKQGFSGQLLCVAHLPLTFTDVQFKEFCEKYGAVDYCYIMRTENSGFSKGYGLVEYAVDTEQVKEIKSELDWLNLDGQILHADFVDEAYQTWEGLQSRCLFVNSMPENFVDVSNLRETFGVVTSPVYCQIMTKGDKSLGFAIIEFRTAEEAEETWIQLRDLKIEDKEVVVTFCIPGKSAVVINNRIMWKFGDKQQKTNSLLPDPVSAKPVIAGNPIVISLSRLNPKLMDDFTRVLGELQQAYVSQMMSPVHKPGLLGPAPSLPLSPMMNPNMQLGLLAMLALHIQAAKKEQFSGVLAKQFNILSEQDVASKLLPKASILGDPLTGQANVILCSLKQQLNQVPIVGEDSTPLTEPETLEEKLKFIVKKFIANGRYLNLSLLNNFGQLLVTMKNTDNASNAPSNKGHSLLGPVPGSQFQHNFAFGGKGSSLLGEPKPMSLLGEPKPMSLLGEPKGMSLFGDPKGMSLLGEPRGMSLFGEQRGSSYFGEAKGTSFYGDTKGTSFFGEHKGGSLLGDPKGASYYGDHKGGSLLGEPKGASYYGEHKPASLLGEPKGGSFYREQKGASLLGEPKGASLLGEPPGGSSQSNQANATINTSLMKAIGLNVGSGSSLGNMGQSLLSQISHGLAHQIGQNILYQMSVGQGVQPGSGKGLLGDIPAESGQKHKGSSAGNKSLLGEPPQNYMSGQGTNTGTSNEQASWKSTETRWGSGAYESGYSNKSAMGGGAGSGGNYGDYSYGAESYGDMSGNAGYGYGDGNEYYNYQSQYGYGGQTDNMYQTEGGYNNQFGSGYGSGSGMGGNYGMGSGYGGNQASGVNFQDGQTFGKGGNSGLGQDSGRYGTDGFASGMSETGYGYGGRDNLGNNYDSYGMSGGYSTGMGDGMGGSGGYMGNEGMGSSSMGGGLLGNGSMNSGMMGNMGGSMGNGLLGNGGNMNSGMLGSGSGMNSGLLGSGSGNMGGGLLGSGSGNMGGGLLGSGSGNMGGGLLGSGSGNMGSGSGNMGSGGGSLKSGLLGSGGSGSMNSGNMKMEYMGSNAGNMSGSMGGGYNNGMMGMADAYSTSMGMGTSSRSNMGSGGAGLLGSGGGGGGLLGSGGGGSSGYGGSMSSVSGMGSGSLGRDNAAYYTGGSGDSSGAGLLPSPSKFMTPAGQKRSHSELLPKPEPSPENAGYIGQHSQGIGGHYLDSYKRSRLF
ncbi:unnamed protein product [Candidula unifasciata]|uniref:RRM domain-containing protein n=1 Tax=Candidula unifasciata TaxID=100452 RepID=A0A8S3ZST4_9EUPU|nr:unnamed protein product [Candidula unifasciata]